MVEQTTELTEARMGQGAVAGQRLPSASQSLCRLWDNIGAPIARLYPQVEGCTARERRANWKDTWTLIILEIKTSLITIAVLPSIRHSLSLFVYQPPAAIDPPDPSAPFVDDSPSEAHLLARIARASLLVG